LFSIKKFKKAFLNKVAILQQQKEIQTSLKHNFVVYKYGLLQE